MRNAAMLLGLVVLTVLTLGSPRSAAACPGCDVDQWCEKGPAGTTCEVFDHDGQRWHRHVAECHDSLTLTALGRKVDTHTPGDTCDQGG